MTRPKLLIITGVALMIGLYFYDRANSSKSVIPATVVTIEARDETEGPDLWYITAEGPMGALQLEPLHARPDVAPGDSICVSRITRIGRADEYRRATGAQTC